MVLLSPVFIIIIFVCVGMFFGGCVMLELEHRDPQVPDHEWQKIEEPKKEE